MATYDYDLFVVGAGSGGVRAARIAAGYGARVAVAEEFRVGGTCVIRGCVPKKLLVYASRFSDEFADAAGFGWTVQPPSFDWATLRTNKEREITRLEGIYGANLARAGVRTLASRAVLEDAHTVRLLAEDRTVTADKILIATGGRPFVPDIEGCRLALTSNEIFDLPQFPRRIVVVGGGYIAVEFASVFRGLGAEVCQVHRGPGLLRGFDREIAAALEEEMRARGIDLKLGAEVTAIRRTGDCDTVEVTDGSTVEADVVLYATGRRPNSDGIGLEHIGVDRGRNGAIFVDQHSRTSVDNIYAVGDVTDRVNLTPVAIREGHAFADTVFGGKPTVVDHSLVPTAVFSTPEIGTVGLTEAEAVERHDAVDIYRTSFRPMRHTLSGRAERTLMKIIVDATTDRVLGVHVLGPDAGEFAQLLGIAVTMGATKADFDRTIAVHPTASEELVTMREPTLKHRRG